VLYRTNSQSRLVEEGAAAIPDQVPHGSGGFSFYDRSEDKRHLSYMKLVQNPHDSIALQRSVNSPPRGIGKTTMESAGTHRADDGDEYVGCDRTGGRGSPTAGAGSAGSEAGSRGLIEDARAMLGPGFGGES